VLAAEWCGRGTLALGLCLGLNISAARPTATPLLSSTARRASTIEAALDSPTGAPLAAPVVVKPTSPPPIASLPKPSSFYYDIFSHLAASPLAVSTTLVFLGKLKLSLCS